MTRQSDSNCTMQVSKSTKIREWLKLTVRRPLEAFDRGVTVLGGQRDKHFAKVPDYQFSTLEDTIQEVSGFFAANGHGFEDEMDEVEAKVRERMTTIAEAPIKQIHSADFSLARLSYVTCRLLKPSVVVETGVAYGVTTSFLLEALARNERGVLHSIDLPPLGPHVDDFVGALVDDEVRDRWTLHRGTTKRLLPIVLDMLDGVDMFVHDSLHTYKNIKLELSLVTPKLRRSAAVLADDVHGNLAFQEWASRFEPAYVAVVKEFSKDSILGVAVIDA